MDFEPVAQLNAGKRGSAGKLQLPTGSLLLLVGEQKVGILTVGRYGVREMADEKDRELLGDIPSPRRTDTLTERIERLRREIGKGERVYTPGELSTLERQLEEYEHLLEILQYR